MTLKPLYAMMNLMQWRVQLLLMQHITQEQICLVRRQVI